MKNTYDYIIVGAGSAGCALAHQLITQSNASVCLIEAGPQDNNPFVHIPAGVPEILYNRRHNRDYTWYYQSNRFSRANKTLEILQGRGLGGSSSVNGMMYILGHSKDFEHWVAMGNDQWSYDEVQRCSQIVHEQVFNGQRQRGAPVKPSQDNVELHDIFVKSCLELGFDYNDNFNDKDLEGVGYVEQNIVAGRRISSARAFLTPIKRNPRFTVLTDTLVDRVVLEGKQAVAVEGRQRGRTLTLKANKEIILCAGGYKSPHILQLSGIGRAEDLRRAGLPIHHEIAAVGYNFQDRFLLPVVFSLKTPVSLNSRLNSNLKKVRVGLQYLLSRRGPAATSHFASNLFYRTDPTLPQPDMELTLIPMLMNRERDSYELFDFDGVTFNVNLLHAQKTGSVLAVSNNPDDPPAIQYDFPYPKDMAVLRHGIDMCRRIVATSHWREHLGGEILPGNIDLHDDEALCNIVFNGYHGAGSCRMGPEENKDTVVTQDLKVKGIAGLRVADGSVMPVLESGHNNLLCMVIGVKAAEYVLQDYQ